MSTTDIKNLSKPYYLFHPEDKRAKEFAKDMAETTGSYELDDADHVLAIGGDGTILYALQNHTHLPVFGVKPTGSRSTLFHGHHNIDNGEALRTALKNAFNIHAVHPLKAEIDFSDGTTKTVYGYNDIIIRNFKAQAALFDLKTIFNGKNPSERTQDNIMGDGIIFANAMGSTAANASHRGLTLKLGQDYLVATGLGIYSPQNGIGSTLQPNDTCFEITPKGTDQKRPLSIFHDGDTVYPNGATDAEKELVIGGRYMTKIKVSVDKMKDMTGTLIVNAQPTYKLKPE